MSKAHGIHYLAKPNAGKPAPEGTFPPDDQVRDEDGELFSWFSPLSVVTISEAQHCRMPRRTTAALEPASAHATTIEQA